MVISKQNKQHKEELFQLELWWGQTGALQKNVLVWRGCSGA